MPWRQGESLYSQALVAWKRGGSLLSTSKFVSRPVFTFGLVNYGRKHHWLLLSRHASQRYPEQSEQKTRRTLHLSTTTTGLIWCFTRKLLLFLLECWWWCETTRTSLQFNSLLHINVTINWIQWDNICNSCWLLNLHSVTTRTETDNDLLTFWKMRNHYNFKLCQNWLSKILESFTARGKKRVVPWYFQ